MKFDLIFSIGPACRPAYHLKQNYLRLFACPLDWQMNYSLATCLHLFQTSFETFFENIYENPDQKGARDNRYIIDVQNSITSIHHFTSKLPLLEAQSEFRTTMKKRYSLLHLTILKSKMVGLICNRNDSLEELSYFLLHFGEIYPNTSFVLINIRSVSSLAKIESSEYQLNSRLSIKEYTFCDEYDTVNHSDGNLWLGNVDAWNQILFHYSLRHHPFSEHIKKINTNHTPIMVYGAGANSHKIIKFLRKYQFDIAFIAVSSRENNPASIENIPVILFCDIPTHFRNHLMIISILDQTESEKVSSMLHASGFQSIIRTDSFLQII